MAEIIEPDKRFIPLNQYKRLYGGSYATLKAACERGELPCITTPAGHYLIDTQPQGASMQPIADVMAQVLQRLEALSNHLGVKL